MDVAEARGTVTAQTSSGIDADSISVNFAGDVCTANDSSSVTCRKEITDSGVEASISRSDVDLPSGYDFAEETFEKSTNGFDGRRGDPTRSLLGY